MLPVEPGRAFDAASHTYTIGDRVVRSVTQLIALAGFGEDFSTVAPDVLTFACDRGREVHAACHLYDLGELNLMEVGRDVYGYVEGYIRWVKECSPVTIASELPMWDRYGQFAGTADWVGFLRGWRSVMDRKTGNHTSPAARLQTAGYQRLWNQLYPSRPIERRYGLRLYADGRYHLAPHEDAADHACFEAILADPLHVPAHWYERYGVRRMNP